MKKLKVLMYAVGALFAAHSVLFAGGDSPIISGNVNPSLKAPITLTAREASLSEVLRVLADRSGMNFVVGEGVQREKITIILNNTPLDESINLLVRASGLSYEIIGNSILIAEPDKLKEDVGLSSYVVELKFAKAEEVATALSDLSKNIKIDKGGNRLICFASPRVIMEIERIVKAIDKPHILVMLETRLIEVNMKKLNQYGLNYSLPVNEGSIGTVLTIPPRSPGSVTFSDISISAIVDLMVSNSDARILMDSKLTTTNNREAELQITDVYPYTIQSYNLSNSGGMNQQIEKENVGVLVKMTPYINDKNQITLSLSPEVSNFVEWVGAAKDIPRTKTRKTNTTVRVENGQKVILAGLLSEDKNVVVSKFPILGDIPVLGLLFQHKKEVIEKSNLIIEVTPRIINDPAEIEKYMTMQIQGDDHKDKKKARRARASSAAGYPATAAAEPAPAPITVQPAPAAAQPVYAPAPAAQPVYVPAPTQPVHTPAPAPAAHPVYVPAPTQPVHTPAPAPAAHPVHTPAPAR